MTIEGDLINVLNAIYICWDCDNELNYMYTVRW